MSGKVVTPGATLADRAAAAIDDVGLQRAMRNLDVRRHTAEQVAATSPELKDRAAVIRRETLADLGGWVERAGGALHAAGATVHRASTPEDVGRIVVAIAEAAGATRAIKSKSMATEEVDLVEVLAAAGVGAVETDLGEYIVQVAEERPSHMIVPAIHKTVGQIADLLGEVSGERVPADHEAITAWARARLRTEFLAGDLGITGANFVTADTGTIVIVTNEGNADLCTLIPRVHVAVVPVEKVIPRLADLATLLPVLTRSATGQDVSNYLTMVTGPRRAGEVDGPEELHVVFLDHGRLRLVGTDYEDMLACIRCGACLNVCPVFRRISGHAYDAVYTGPMGKILTPLLDETGTEGRDLPGASSLCGACAEACPVEIPLPDLLVRLRADLRAPGGVRPRPLAPATRASAPSARRPGEGLATAANAAPLVGAGRPSGSWRVWAALWSSPRGYRWSTRLATSGSRLLGRGWSRAAIPGTAAWRRSRDLPLPASPVLSRPMARARRRCVVSTAAPLAIPAEFLAAADAHRLTVHGPVSAAGAAAAVIDVVARIAAGGTVARPVADATLERFGILDALADLPGPRADAPDWTAALPQAAVGVTGVDLVVAATGTLVIAAHAGRPRGTHILPRSHVAVVSLTAIVPTLTDALASLAASGLASNVSWVSGPSRTADLEMRPTIGVHGPVAVDVVVVA